MPHLGDETEQRKQRAAIEKNNGRDTGIRGIEPERQDKRSILVAKRMISPRALAEETVCLRRMLADRYPELVKSQQF